MEDLRRCPERIYRTTWGKTCDEILGHMALSSSGRWEKRHVLSYNMETEEKNQVDVYVPTATKLKKKTRLHSHVNGMPFIKTVT